jgi:hypothetical protein
MTFHASFQRLLAASHDLSPGERGRLQHHLERCARCRLLANEYCRQDVFLRAVPAMEPAPMFQRAVFGRIAARVEEPRRRWRPFRMLSATALSAFLLLTAWLASGVSRPLAVEFPAAMVEQMPAFAGIDAPAYRGQAVPASPLISPRPPKNIAQSAGRLTRQDAPPPLPLMVRLLDHPTRHRPTPAHRPGRGRPRGPRTRGH